MRVKKPLVSIIMNCYNSDRFLREAIESVYSQTYSNWEVIFWDNASTDNSASIANSYDERIKYYLATKTTPLGEARNFALRNVSGKYIAFLDCDDLFLPEKLQKQVELMEILKVPLCYGSALIIDEGGFEVKRSKVKNKSGYIFDRLLKHYEINMQSVMIESGYLAKQDLNFSRDLKYCPDYNLFMEICSKSEVGVIHDFIVKYRFRKNSLSSKTLDLAPVEIKYTLDNILNHNPDFKEKYPKQIKLAYSKVVYYKAIYCIKQKKFKEAQYILRKIILIKWQYLALYFILFFPFIPNFFIKIIRK
jgi:glycosyltransferase involved in cell wall biosynthesis